LEVSQSKLGRLIRRPKVVRDLDLQDAVWPDELNSCPSGYGSTPKILQSRCGSRYSSQRQTSGNRTEPWDLPPRTRFSSGTRPRSATVWISPRETPCSSRPAGFLSRVPLNLLEERVTELLWNFGLLFDVEYLDLHPVVQSG
jgi:hypothetical protein